MNLTKAQRIELQLLLEAKVKKTKIAEALGVHLSSIYRELKRNSFHGKYDAIKADQLAKARKKVAGGMSKVKRKTINRRKNKYELFDDRRFIYWKSDTPRARRRYFFLKEKWPWKTKRYKIRLGWEKTHHYRNDIPLFELLIAHLKENHLTTTKTNQPSSFKQLHYSTNSTLHQYPKCKVA
ncbi:helix-turn-helix domain-containing protein [Flammeovirga sp. EKP202]|uniref:helix-turn-helix domain-containing protein n=1 Tax=Flammeovirga sp. EKP202 TaxID=2770592 RepID=UPI00165F1CF0|nr:helix-turn-helix domain-containing protein [Flammeovirga sp. EKP202]MBD0403876.1 helix-turn-helix domain-containing protein [Flammeovirga sp. EKP202]